MKKLKFLLLAGLMAFTTQAFSACGEELDSPTNLTQTEDYQVNWDRVDGARSYLVSVKDCDTKETTETATRKPTISLAKLDEGLYEVKVKAISGANSMGNSDWSITIEFRKNYENGCVYTLINNRTEYEVTSIGTATGDLIIDGFYRGKPVTSIADEAFKGKSALTSVVIGNNVKSIGEEAFLNCTKLEKVTLPDTLVEMGDSVFQGCSKLSSISIPDNVSVISEEAFAYCRGLKTLELGASVQAIMYGAFSNCFALETVVLPDSLTYVDENAFYRSSALTSVTVGTGVEYIGP